MTNSKTTKRALFSSVVALLLCFTMLLGTTFAWFTDSAASGSNVITAGNLDIVVEYTLDGENWDDLDGATDLFQKGLWEPGHTEVVLLKITNNGSLALKYAANMNIVNEIYGKTKDGADIKLSEILTVSTCTQQYTDGNGNIASGADIFPAMTFNGDGGVDGWIGYQTTSTFKAGNVLKNDKQLQPKESDYIAVKVDMAETVTNEANHNGTDIPTINFGINVLATQFTYENDSFGNQYDKNAFMVNSDEDFKEAITSNDETIIIELASDVTYDVAARDKNAMGGTVTKKIIINGNGYTITFNHTDSDWNNIATNGAKLIINDAHLTNAGHNDGPWNRHDLTFACEVELNNVTSDKAMAFVANATLNDVTINDANTSDTYAIWIQANGQTIDIDGLTIDMLDCTDGRGIKIDEQYVTAEKVTLNVSNATFKTEEKGAILVKSAAGADIALSNVDISGVKADTDNEVWVDEDAADSFDDVTVIGGDKILEGAGAVVVVGSAADLIAALANGGNVTLNNDITISSSDLLTDSSIVSIPVGMLVNEDTVLDMNGHNIVIADNGTGTAAAIFVKDADLTIVGDGTITQEGSDDYLLWAKGASTVTINSGTFVTNPDDCSVFYASGNTSYDPTDDYATINIYGGTFTSGHPSEAGDNANVMNHGVGRINYYGGTFNWDPSVTHVDDASYIKVADGYKVVDNGNGTWTVTAE